MQEFFSAAKEDAAIGSAGAAYFSLEVEVRKVIALGEHVAERRSAADQLAELRVYVPISFAGSRRWHDPAVRVLAVEELDPAGFRVRRGHAVVAPKGKEHALGAGG